MGKNCDADGQANGVAAKVGGASLALTTSAIASHTSMLDEESELLRLRAENQTLKDTIASQALKITTMENIIEALSGSAATG